MRWKGYGLVACIDDYVGIAPARDAQAQFDYLLDLHTRLGLPMNPDKCVPPSKVLTCLGIQVDIVNSSLSIDQAKLHAIHNECFQVVNKKYLSKRCFQHCWVSLYIYTSVLYQLEHSSTESFNYLEITLVRKESNLPLNSSKTLHGSKLSSPTLMALPSLTNPGWRVRTRSLLMLV